MFLKEIELINFKCHEHLKLYFDTTDKKHPIRKTTFLLGENGTGKSALLKAIALVTAGSGALGNILGAPDSWIRNGKKFCEIAAIIVTAKGEKRAIRLKITRGNELREVLEENKDSLVLIDEAIKNADRNYFVIAYGASRRLNRGDTRFAKSNRPQSARTANISSLFDPDASLISLSNWAMDLDYSSGEAGLKIIRNALKSFLLENVRFKKIDKLKGQLIFNTPDGDVPLDQLSDGYQNVAAWVGDLMYNITNTFRDHKDPLKARGLLLIDEIDLHLHPKWQRQLHAFLKEKLPFFQVLATTHSPLTAQQAQEDELYALRRTDKQIELVPFNGDPSKMLVHQILMSPVFGLSTDESVKVEQAKVEVRKIRLSGKSNKVKKEEIAKFTDVLSSIPINTRNNELTEQSDLKLLKAINEKLKPAK